MSTVDIQEHVMRIRTTRALGAVTLAAAAFTTRRPALAGEARAPSAPNVVTVGAGDYVFEAPASIPAGLTTFRLATTGKEMHEVTIFGIANGHTRAELLEAMKSPHATVPPWAVAGDGPKTPAPGSTFDVTVDLQPGNYALVCLIPSSDGAPHVMKGMVKPLTVTFLSWAEKMPGPPPGLPIGGVTFLSPQQANLIDVDFAPGRYALLCFVPDAKDGKPHFVHGMVQEIEIR